MIIDRSKLITADALAATALKEAHAKGVSDLVAWVDATTTAITGNIPEAEKLSWTKKETAARAILDGNADASQTAMIKMEAEILQRKLEEVCRAIVANADSYTNAIAVLTGIRQSVGAQIGSAKSADEVAALLNMAQAAWAKAAG
jgi:hypothetical protein